MPPRDQQEKTSNPAGGNTRLHAPANQNTHANTQTTRKPFLRTVSVPKNPFHSLKKRLFAISTVIAAGAALTIFMVGRYATPDFTFMIAALCAVAGLVGYDILSRRLWENTITERVEDLTRHYEKLVREVARNRNDLFAFKQGLSETAEMMQAIGTKRSPAPSTEGHMMTTLIRQFSKLGRQPQPKTEKTANTPPKEKKAPDNVIQLDMTPPPQKEAPLSALERATTENFSSLSRDAVLEMVRHAVNHDQIEIFAQPVVRLPQRQTCMYEVFARLRAKAGAYLPAGRYLEAARQERLIPAMDNILLLRCLQMLGDRRNQKADGERPYILNITAATLHDRGFMGDLVTFLADHRQMAGRLIFELPQADFDSMDHASVQIMDGLARLGCRFSLDRIRNRTININTLKSRHIRYIKLDASWLIRNANAQGGAQRIAQLKRKLDIAGIDLIVEHMETEHEVRELLDFNIDYGQGYLFGKPDHYATYRDRELAKEMKKTA